MDIWVKTDERSRQRRLLLHLLPPPVIHTFTALLHTTTSCKHSAILQTKGHTNTPMCQLKLQHTNKQRSLHQTEPPELCVVPSPGLIQLLVLSPRDGAHTGRIQRHDD